MKSQEYAMTTSPCYQPTPSTQPLDNWLDHKIFYPWANKNERNLARLLPSKSMVYIRSCREEILVLLNSCHRAPQTTIFPGIKTHSEREKKISEGFHNWLGLSLGTLQGQQFHGWHPPRFPLEGDGGTLYQDLTSDGEWAGHMLSEYDLVHLIRSVQQGVLNLVLCHSFFTLECLPECIFGHKS